MVVLLHVVDRWRVVEKRNLLTGRLRELGEVVLKSAARCFLGDALFHTPFNVLAKFARSLMRANNVSGSRRAYQTSNARISLNSAMCSRYDRAQADPGPELVQAGLPAHHHETCREPLEVPFPGRREGLVEVVDVEVDLALRSRWRNRENCRDGRRRMPARERRWSA